MAALPIRTFASLTQGFAAGVQGRARALTDFSVGSVLRAVAEANADLLLWLQSIVVYVLTRIRATTSKGPDLDSWLADFDFVRLGARPATGQATFSRLSTPTSVLVVPVGGLVQIADGSQRFQVVADPTHGAWSAALNGYQILAGAASVVGVPIRALTPGVAGNVAAGLINLIASAMPGVDLVSNPAGLTNGMEAETDGAALRRFWKFINQLAKGTVPAIEYCIETLQLGLRTQVLDCALADGTLAPGIVTVFVDDGSGAPSAALVTAARAAVGPVKSGGVQVVVLSATSLLASVQLTVQVAPGYDSANVVAAVVAALSVYINGLGLGVKLRFTRLEQVAYDASPGVTNVTAVTLNSGVIDLAPANGQTIKASALSVIPAV